MVNVWSKRSEGDEAAVIQTFTEADVDYLCNQVYPFIQMINAKMSFDNEFTLNLIESNWTIHDFGDAISTSAKSPQQASVGQQIVIAKDLIKRLMAKNWSTVEIIAGTPVLQRFVWIESKRAQFEIRGYTPTERDEEVYKRLFENLKDVEKWEYDRPKAEKRGGVGTAS